MTTVLRSIGWDACQLEGGYKAFRTQVLADLGSWPAKYRFQVISGSTGSAKTRLLQYLASHGEQVLDLENLACHKGSVLGRQPGQPQPSQKWFETLIWQALRHFDPNRPIFVEAESRKIGSLRLPAELFAAMQVGEVSEIQASITARVDFLLRDYAYFTDAPTDLRQQLDSLRPLLGHERVANWQAQIDTGDFSGLTHSLLVQHYDPLYHRARQRDYQPASLYLQTDALDTADIARLATALLAHTRKNR